MFSNDSSSSAEEMLWTPEAQKGLSTIRLRYPVPGTILAGTGAGTGLEKMAGYPANRNRISGTSLSRTGGRFYIHSRDGSTLLCEMISCPPSWNYGIISEIRLHQSMHIYLKNNSAKYHPNPIGNDTAAGFLKRLLQQEEEQQDSDTKMRSVPDPKASAQRPH